MNELVLVSAGIASALNLGLGFFIGRKLRTDTPRESVDRIEELSEHTSNRIEQHIRRVDIIDGNLGSNPVESLPSQQEILKAISELRDANQQLQVDLRLTQQELHSFKAKTKRRRARTRSVVLAPSTAASESLGLSEQRPGKSSSTEHAPSFRILDTNHVTVNSPSPRKEFHTQQLLAPYDSGKIPGRDEFQTIQCWDIGSDGFSFLAAEPPSFLLLVLALGEDPNRTYLSARVVGASPSRDRGLAECQVQCQFTGRLHPHLFK